MVVMMDVDLTAAAAEMARRCREYMDALVEERKKIQVFHRELPLSLHLVTQTIESCKQQMAGELLFPGSGGGGGRSECEEKETSSEGTVLEEFIPLKPSSSAVEADKDQNDGHSDDEPLQEEQKKKEKLEEKTDWLRSVLLWSQDSDPQLPNEDNDGTPRRPIVVEAKKPSGAFHPFRKEKHSPPPPPPVAAEVTTVPPPPPAPAVSSTSGASSGGGEDKEGQQLNQQHHRKSRRCWSPELHRRFVLALEQLGGSHVATPKQIRELMKVDGLTNDEVKSHLQKFRLHSRRPIAATAGVGGGPQPPQVVLLSGIWVPSPEYALAAAAAAAAVQPPEEGIVTLPKGVYAPIASVPTPKQHQVKQSQRSPTSPLLLEGRGGQDDPSLVGATNSDSPANSSSSSETTTNSPPF